VKDIFKEQIIKRAPTMRDTAVKVGLAVGVLLVFIASTMFAGKFAFLLVVGAGFGAYWCLGRQNIEYEYTVTGDTLDIDIIYNRAKRRQVFSGVVTDFELMANVLDQSHTHDFDSAQETRDYSAGTGTGQRYAFLAQYKNRRVKVIIEPDDSLLEAFSSLLTPRKFFRYKQ